jgi:hypothetical protein
MQLVPVRGAAAQELARSVRVTVENDYFDFWIPPDQRPDENYTHGTRVSWDIGARPAIARRLLCDARRACGSELEIGQELYTPVRNAMQPEPGDRPHAGWLYAHLSSVGADARTLRSLGVTLGVTGPPSLAAQAQRAFHAKVGFRAPLGWDQQLPTEIAVALLATRAWRVAPPGRAGTIADVVPTAQATLGTLRTSLGAGARLRLGSDLSHPWLVVPQSGPASVHVFVGVRGEAIGRDLFLDGSTFRSSVRVAKSPLVSEWERGVGLRVDRLSMEYRAVTRGREYRTGPASHSYGGISVSWSTAGDVRR